MESNNPEFGRCGIEWLIQGTSSFSCCPTWVDYMMVRTLRCFDPLPLALEVRARCRYELPELGALSFVLKGAPSGSVTRSLVLDPHGKSLCANCSIFEPQSLKEPL
ncbi:MAG: hypothetical protein ABIO85_09155 [Sphingomicrobium sp.]